MLNHSSGIPPRAIRALTGRGNNPLSLSATLPCTKSFLATTSPTSWLPIEFHLHQCPSFSEMQDLACKGRLHTTDDGIVLLVRQQTPPHPSDSSRPVGRAVCLLKDEPIRI